MKKEFSNNNPAGWSLAEIRKESYEQGYADGASSYLQKLRTVENIVKKNTINRVMKILDDGRAVTKAELEAIRKESP